MAQFPKSKKSFDTQKFSILKEMILFKFDKKDNIYKLYIF